MKINRVKSLNGELTIPGDKSISHRSIMFGSIADGITEVHGFLNGADCISSMNCFRQMGIDIDYDGSIVTVHGKGLNGLSKPEGTLDVGNSGTTTRLISGILAAQPFASRLIGDASICKRPMKRIMTPLSMMGADITSELGNDCAPLLINGKELWICGALALACGLVYSGARGYDAQMYMIGLGVYLYKVIDGTADVYEGRLQQADKLYLAGMSQTLRSVGVLAVFTVALFLTRSMPIAAMAMGITAIASLVLVTAPLALLETEKSRRVSLREVGHLFVQCAPLFGALFLFNLIESMPKFVMEGTLSYKYQLYFNALFFPAQAILLSIGFIYKPQLLRLSSIWANPRKRRRFDLIIVAVMALIVVITGACAAFMSGPGIPIMSFMYGLNFERYRTLALLMVVAGGVTAAIDFIYAIITVLRHAGDVTKIYLICFAVSVVLPLILVNLLGLTGAVVSYLAVMALLLVLLIIEYTHIRQRIERDRNPYGA